MYNYKFSKQVLKFLERQNKDFLLLFYEKFELLSKNPFLNDLDIKPLKWIDNNYRLRIWKYRFLYEINKDILYIYFYKAWTRWYVYK